MLLILSPEILFKRNKWHKITEKSTKTHMHFCMQRICIEAYQTINYIFIRFYFKIALEQNARHIDI